MSDEELCKALRSALWGQGHHINIKAADRIEQLEKELSISRMASVVMDNTVSELEAKLAKAVKALRWAYETVKEINPSNYDHDDVCNMNDASVEVILGIRATLTELEGGE